MRYYFQLFSVVITTLLFLFPFPCLVEAQNKTVVSVKEAGLVENGVIRAETFGLRPGETKANQTKALQAIVDLYANNVPHNSWDINLQNPEPTIIIPAGEYNVGEIELRSYVTIKGAGRGSTLLRGVTFKAENQYNINIEGLSLVGVNSHSTNHYKKTPNEISGTAAIAFRDCGRVIMKNVAIRNYNIAIDFYNTVLTDFYSCYISYCDIGFKNDGKGNGYGGHAIRWLGGEICESNIGVFQKMGNSVSFIGATLEGCDRAFSLEYPVSFNINSCYFEANTFDVFGNIIHTNIEDCFFSDAHKKKEGTYIYAESIGQTIIQGNKFNRQVGGHPYVEFKKGGKYYHNLYIGQNDIVGGGRIIVSDSISDAIEERGRTPYQTYLPDGKQLMMGQTIVYRNTKTNKYYLVTRDSEGKLLYLPFDYNQ